MILDFVFHSTTWLTDSLGCKTLLDRLKMLTLAPLWRGCLMLSIGPDYLHFGSDLRRPPLIFCQIFTIFETENNLIFSYSCSTHPCAQFALLRPKIHRVEKCLESWYQVSHLVPKSNIKMRSFFKGFRLISGGSPRNLLDSATSKPTTIQCIRFSRENGSHGLLIHQFWELLIMGNRAQYDACTRYVTS